MQQRTETHTTAKSSFTSYGMGFQTPPVIENTIYWEKEKIIFSKFLIGEQTDGQKVDAVSVSRLMVSARDTNGVKLFNSAEFLR